MAASPRWLSDFAGNFGPLLMWVPLLLAARNPSGDLKKTLTAALLRTTIAWYLLVIGPVRHTHRLLSALGHPKWDPSGHVTVYGSQLLPFWMVAAAAAADSSSSRRPPPLSSSAPLAWCALWSCVLWYLSFATGSFFHTCSETFAAWLLTLGLLGALIRHRELLMRAGGGGRGRGGGDGGGGGDAGGGSRVISAGSSAASADEDESGDDATAALRPEAAAVLSRWESALHSLTWLVALPVWVLVAAAACQHALREGGAKEQPILLGMAAYDLCLWLLLGWLGGGPCANPSGRPGFL